MKEKSEEVNLCVQCFCDNFTQDSKMLLCSFSQTSHIKYHLPLPSTTFQLPPPKYHLINLPSSIKLRSRSNQDEAGSEKGLRIN